MIFDLKRNWFYLPGRIFPCLVLLAITFCTIAGCKKAATKTTSTGPVPLGIPGNWTLKFDDEFNGTSLDTLSWWPNWFGSTRTTITVPINSTEAVAYDPAQITVSGGYLNLSLAAKPVTVNGTTYQYRSGMVQTNGSGATSPFHQFTFGAFEARINLPASSNGAVANWPAWWTDGQNWPTDGEMDVVEGLGGSACYHFHSPTTAAGDCPAGNFAGWHTYGANWRNGAVDYYYDGVLVGTLNSGITNARMYLILNYSTGGCCTGAIVAPATMQVDYVRVWQ
jgi:beta-glucanase (GH16 family)